MPTLRGSGSVHRFPDPQSTGTPPGIALEKGMLKEPSDLDSRDERTGDERRGAQPDPSRLQRFGPIAVILAVATALRVFRLSRPSYWYDEVVTMQLARQANPLALLRILPWIDASEAPLQPL